MKKSYENNINNEYITGEFYSAMFDGIVELKKGIELSSSSSSESSETSESSPSTDSSLTT